MQSQIQRVGIIGGGQLAWMMAPAAQSLGVELVVQTPHPTDPAASIATETILAPIDDSVATAELAEDCDVITFENEFVDLQALASLEAQGFQFVPRLQTLAPLLDKYDQRCYLQAIHLPVPKFRLLTQAEMADPNFSLEFPVVLKARRHGYDGQGTFIVKSQEQLLEVWQKLDQDSVLLEEFVPFDRELAVMAARSLTGEVVIYPVVETQQEKQVCRRVLVPADIPAAVTQEVEAIARTLLQELDAIGIFGIELFLTQDHQVLVNEIAPRTHNSGHYTIDASQTSQFEQHLRIACQRPLGSPALNCTGAVMVNLLGYEYSQSDYLDKRQELADIPGAKVHWYGKTKAYPGRKLGHVTVRITQVKDEWSADALELARTIESIWYTA